MKKLPVIEIFGPTLQGEGSVIGLKTMFLRLAGCDYSCSWCDSKYTWQKGAMAPITWLEPEAIRSQVEELGGNCRQLSISGGNPALHDLNDLITTMQRAPGYWINVETQGSLAPDWFGRVDSVTVSPKGPSSGMATDWEALAASIDRSRAPTLKVVVFDAADYEYAATVHGRFPEVPLYLQVGNNVGSDDSTGLLQRLHWLAERVIGDERLSDVRVLPQMHVLLWGNKRGV